MLGENQLVMGKPNSTEEFEVAKNTMWGMGKPKYHDYISVLEENQLVMGKPDSTEEVEQWLRKIGISWKWVYPILLMM